MENDSKKEKLDDENEESFEMSDNEPYYSNDDDSPEEVDDMVNRLSKQYAAPKGRSHNILDSKRTKPI